MIVEKLENRPLVTFALFAYNQEKYIRDAIEAAIAQTYEPLEIILSDDCSIDGTFEIMEKLSSSVERAGSLVLNRNTCNMGIGGHINKISEIASGDIIVLAAGDDVSLPNRVEEVVSFFRENPTKFAVFSSLNIISDEGELIKEGFSSWVSGKSVSDFALIRRGGGVGTGASYAYRKECFNWPRPYPESLLNEDRILPWRAFFLGGVGYINKALVDYRQSVSGVSRTLPEADLVANIKDEHILELVDTVDAAFREGFIKERKMARYKNWLSCLKDYKLSQKDSLKKMGWIGSFFSKVKTIGFYARGFTFQSATFVKQLKRK